MIIDFAQKRDEMANRGAQYRSGQISEAVFRASMMALGLRRDDIDVMAVENSPVSRRHSEDQRYAESLQWLRDYLDSHKGRRQ